MTTPRTNAGHDQNHNPTIMGVSSADGTTPVPVEVDPSTGALLVSSSGGAAGTQYAEGVTTNPATGTVALGRYTTTPPLLTNGQLSPPQLDSASNLKASILLAAGDASPSYNTLSLGGIPLRTDSAGNLQTYSEVVTDQGASRAVFTGSSISFSPGTATFTNGSVAVTGTGFSTTDIHYLDFIKISAHAESAWAQVSYVNSDTSITLIAAYTGATNTGAYDLSRVATVTGTGATVSVASGQLTLAAGTNTSAATVVYKTAAFPPLQNITGEGQFSISQRVANQDIYVGLESATSAPRYFARFHFSGTTNTSVITETGYNPTTTPSASETETNTVTLPNSVTSAAVNTYKIEQQYDRVIFSVNGQIVATHLARLPHVWQQSQNQQIRVVNSGAVTNTNIVCNYLFIRAYSRLDVTVPGGVMVTDGTNNVNVNATTTNKNGQYISPNSGTGSAVPANAFYGGLLAQTALPSAATAGNLTGGLGDKFGRSVNIIGTVRDLVGTQTTTISASTSETTIVTAAASVFNDVTTLVVSNTSATATRVDFRDTTAGTILFSLYVPAGDMRGFCPSRPLPQTSVNTNWTAQSSASVTDLRVYAVFDKNK